MLEDQIIKYLKPLTDKYKLSWKRIITMPSISDDYKTISMLLKGDNLDVVIDMDIKIKNNRWYIERTKVTIGIPEQKFGNNIMIEKTKNKDDVLRTLSLAIFKTKNNAKIKDKVDIKGVMQQYHKDKLYDEETGEIVIYPPDDYH